MVIGAACVASGAPLPGAALLLLMGLESSVHRTPTPAPTPTPTPARAPTPRAYAGTLPPGGAALLTLTPSVTLTPTLSRHAAVRCRAAHLVRTRGSHAAGLGGRAHCRDGAARYADTAHCTLHAMRRTPRRSLGALHARGACTGTLFRRTPSAHRAHQRRRAAHSAARGGVHHGVLAACRLGPTCHAARHDAPLGTIRRALILAACGRLTLTPALTLTLTLARRRSSCGLWTSTRR